MADVQAKPVPVPDSVSRPYWDGANQGQFRFQRCRACGQAQFHPRFACVHCQGIELQWQVAGGGGRVASFSVVHRAPLASFAGDTPYVLALVDLDEGPRFMCNVLNCDPAAVRVGMRVRVCFESRPGSAQRIPQVEPADMNEPAMFNYDHYEPGRNYGTRDFTVDESAVARWRTVYPNDNDPHVMPGGMLAMIVIDAVLTLNAPRPPGGVHGGQTFDIERMPRIGETLRTEVWCLDKEIRKNRKWVRMRTETRALGSGELLFSGIMTTLVPQ